MHTTSAAHLENQRSTALKKLKAMEADRNVAAKQLDTVQHELRALRELSDRELVKKEGDLLKLEKKESFLVQSALKKLLIQFQL